MEGLARKTMSILCLMMILPGGLANPVAGEGGEGLDFVAGLVDSAFSWFIPDSVSNETDALHDQDDDNATKATSGEGIAKAFNNLTKGDDKMNVMHNQSYVKSGRMETVGSLGYGRAFVADSVENLGFVNGVQEESLCCEECHKEHPSAEFYDFIYQSFKNVATTSCTCKTSKPFVRPMTREVGISSGQCGTWTYRGQGPLGDGVYFESGVWELGDMASVNDSSICCEECSRRFPGTTMFTFINKINKCQCYSHQRGQTPVTRLANFSTGACVPKSSAIEVTETEIESASEASKPKVELKDQMMNDASAAVSDDVTNEDVDGELGDGKIFNPNTMSLVNYTYASASGDCCSKCQDLQYDARFFIFSKDNPQCACLTPKYGVKPATMDPGSGFKNWMSNPVAGVCGAEGSKKEVQLGNLMMADAPAAVSNQGNVADGTGDGLSLDRAMNTVLPIVKWKSYRRYVAGGTGDVAGGTGDVAGGTGDVAGGTGDGRTLDRDTVTWLHHVPGDSSEECCAQCQATSLEATLFVFSKSHHQCACFTPKEGVQPASTRPDYWIPQPVTGVCGTANMSKA